MRTYFVTVWASFDVNVVAKSAERAEEKAIDKSPFPYADYCEVEHVKNTRWYKVTVWASYEMEVDADSEEEAEEIAVFESPFPYADYCEIDEV